MSRLKVGLVGCGKIAQLVHLNILSRLPDVALVALAEPDLQRRQEARRRVPGVVAFADYRELVSMPDVGAVVICLPNALHAEAAVAALQHGKHVYLEKPLATSLREARDMLAAWRRAGVVGMIGFNYRFNTLYEAARRCVQSGRLGELVGARSVFSVPAQALPAWKRMRDSGGGTLLDLASHHVDLIRFLLGQEVREVFAQVRSQRSEGDSAMVHLRLASGLLVQSFFSMCAVEEDRLEVYGQAGKLTVDRHLSLSVEIRSPTLRFARVKRLWRHIALLPRLPLLFEKIRAPVYEPSYRVALAYFAARARNNQPASPDFSDGYACLAVVEAAEQSSRTGRIVSLTDVADEGAAR